MPELNEGVLTGIMNFFSKVFGGRVTELDRILEKYKRNEGSYWKKWSEANHEYNKASALRDSSEDNIERQKYMERMERASKLIKQTTKTRDEVNSALDRQAVLIIRDNRRLRTYWEVKKAKAKEEVSNKSYTSLKKEVDDDTLDILYDNARKAQKRAQGRRSGGQVRAGTTGAYESQSEGEGEDIQGRDRAGEGPICKVQVRPDNRQIEHGTGRNKKGIDDKTTNPRRLAKDFADFRCVEVEKETVAAED